MWRKTAQKTQEEVHEERHKESEEEDYSGQQTHQTPSQLSPHVQHCVSISDFFNFIISNAMVSSIVVYTNKRLVESDHTNIVELRCFFGLLLLFGVLKKNDVDTAELWSPDSAQHSNHATAAMSRKRFRLLIRKLTFDDIDEREQR